MRLARHRLGARFSWDLAVLLACFLLLATVYAWAIPYFQSSDEISHFEFVKRLVYEGQLPVITEQQYFAAEQHQPPAYYMMASLVGRVLLAGPFGETAGKMAVIFYGARALSVFFGLATVAGAYLLASHFSGGSRLLKVGATAMVAFNPSLIAIMAAVTNDSMAAAVGVFVLLATVKVASAARLSLVKLSLVGLVTGLAAVTKENLLYLLLPLAFALVVLATRSRSPGYVLSASAAVLAPALAVGGWWYLRNWVLYGDPLAWNVNALLSPGNIHRQLPVFGSYLSVLLSAAETYWVGFGNTTGVRAPLPVYLVLWAGCGVAVLGLCRYLGRKDPPAGLPPAWKLGLALLAADVGLALLADLSYHRSFVGAGAGRYFFPVAGAVGVLLATGLSRALPLPRPRRTGTSAPTSVGTTAPWLLMGFCLVLVALSAATPTLFLLPMRVSPPVLTEVELRAEAQPADALFDRSMQLVGYRINEPLVTPGDNVRVSLYWKAAADTTTVWTNYVHIVDSQDVVFGQYDSIPFKERYPALFWKKGEVWRDDVDIAVAPDAPNGFYRLQVGLYSLQTGLDAPVSAQGKEWVGGLLLGQIRVVAPEPAPAAMNPAGADFQESVRLLGWAYRDGKVTLYWQPGKTIARPLTVFVHFLDAGSRVVAQDDSWPAGGRMPTFVWQPGEVVRDEHPLAAPLGTYTLEVGLYESGNQEPVPLVTGSRSLLLAEVKVP